MMRKGCFLFRGGRPALVSLLAIMAACTLPAEAARAGIVAYWNFNDNFNANVGGSGFNLTSANGASIQGVAAKFGPGGADFERASSQYAFVNNAIVVPSNSDFSYSAWYFLDVADITGTDRYFVLESTAGTVSSTPTRIPISLGLRDRTQDVAEVFWSVNAGSTNNNFYFFPDGNNRQWHNVITTYNKNTQTITTYLNGNQMDTRTVVGTMDPGSGLVVGGNRAGTGRNWEGYIDDIAIWDEVIDSTEIARLQTQAVVPVPEPSSVLLACTGLLTAGGMLFRRRRSASPPKR